jgi:hypothetical protein
MATAAFKMLLLGLACWLASWWMKSSVPLWLFLLLATQAGLLGLGLLAELVVRQSGQRLEAIRQSIAEVKTFKAQVETDVR